MKAPETFSVMVTEHHHVPDDDASWFIDGFPSLELAREFARRWTRDSFEEHRASGRSRKKIIEEWRMWGESAIVVGGPKSLYAVDDAEIEFFLDHPATTEERDWKAIKKQAGLPT